MNLIDEGTDVDSNGACFLAGTVCAFHASAGFSPCLFFGVDAIVERACPVVSEVTFRYSFEFDFMLMSVVLPILSGDDLRLIEMRGCG